MVGLDSTHQFPTPFEKNLAKSAVKNSDPRDFLWSGTDSDFVRVYRPVYAESSVSNADEGVGGWVIGLN